MSALLDRRPARPSAPRASGAPFRVRLVAHRRGGEVSITDLPASFAGFHSAGGEADRIQRDCDEDCSPVTAYVLDADGMPIHRAATA